MRWQRNTFKTKNQDKTSEEELYKVAISNQPNKKFKVMIIKIFNKLREKMDEHSENFKKQLGTKEPNINWNKNTLEGTNSELDDKEECISKLEHSVGNNHSSWKEKKKKKIEDTLKDQWDNIKHTNICMLGVQKAEETEKERKWQRIYLKT